MTSVELIPIDSINSERRPLICIDESDHLLEYPLLIEETESNIPYHAREHARPFTYGNLPKDFKSTDLHHVESPIADEFERRIQTTDNMLQSPYLTRKTIRPSISPSRPVLHKTPSREKFEEMLMERREKSLLEQNNEAVKLEREAAIQKDLNELQRKLNKRVRIAENAISKDLIPVPVRSNNMVGNSPVLPPRVIPLPSTIAVGNEVALVGSIKRSETPTFPVLKAITDGRCDSPYPKRQPVQDDNKENDAISRGYSTQPHDVAPHLVNFARDSSEYWYKPHMTRDDAVGLLRSAAPGTFLIRNSTTYKDAFGLVLRVAKPPPGVLVTQFCDELVRHFLLEPTILGIRLKSCSNEPVFSSLSAFVYQHSINPMALPCKLIIPKVDLLQNAKDSDFAQAHQQLLGRGAACNVLYLYSCDTESLTGCEALRRTINDMYAQKQLPIPVEVHFKVSQSGITITDNTRRTFFRRHYATQNVSYCSIDPENRLWRIHNINYTRLEQQQSTQQTIFGFVARTTTGMRENQCHIFCDLAKTQPASAIVSFTNKLMPTCQVKINNLL